MDGKQCIIIEQPSAIFKALPNLLHMSSINEQIAPLPVFGNEVERYHCSRIMSHYFQEDSAIFLAFNSFGFMLHTSNIMLSKVDEEKIVEWLESVEKTETPKLLYRASRDGWDASDFHRMCNGKGATVTVVKSSGGYIFGGYTGVAWGESGGWKSSAESFLFSLKDHAGIGPVKMPIKSDKKDRVVFHNSIVGPSFGGGPDLYVESNANAAHSESSSSVGDTYQLPSNTNDPHFLTGSKNFAISE